MTIKKIRAYYRNRRKSMLKDTRGRMGQTGNMPGAKRPIQVAIKNPTYKDHEIHAAPYQLADTSEWEICIHIFHDHGDQMGSRKFSTGNSFKTRDEAVAHCLNFGRQIIDGKIENCTVNGL